MKKQLLLFGLSILLLVSCGSEATELKKKAGYIYVEIEECSIPVPKIYEMAKHGNMHLYEHNYSYSDKYIQSLITKKRYEDDYENLISFIKKSKTMKLGLKRNRNNFSIVEVNSTFDDKIIYYLFGINTHITLSGSNEEELDYILKYCKKTWKLNKGEKNASTPK